MKKFFKDVKKFFKDSDHVKTTIEGERCAGFYERYNKPVLHFSRVGGATAQSQRESAAQRRFLISKGQIKRCLPFSVISLLARGRALHFFAHVGARQRERKESSPRSANF